MPSTDRTTYNLFIAVTCLALALLHHISFVNLVILAVLTLATCSRLKDIGYPPAYGVLVFAPLANVVLVLASLSLPRHNGRSIRMDKAGWVLLILWLLAPVMALIIVDVVQSFARPY